MDDAQDDERPERERTNSAAIRDLLAGAALLAIGVLVGGSALDGRADGLDYVFDALGVAWIGWGAARWIANARKR